MRAITRFAPLASAACLFLFGASAFAQDAQQAPPPPAPAATQAQTAPPPPPPQAQQAQPQYYPQQPQQNPDQVQVQVQPQPQPPQGQEAPPPQSQWVYSYPTGQWVYTVDYGWVWIPAGAETTDADGVPYSYMYTPAYGWTWYVSPWGPGAYHYGVWVRHAWAPVGWRGGWVAHPNVFVRLGGHAGFRGGYHGGGFRGGYHGGGGHRR